MKKKLLVPLKSIILFSLLVLLCSLPVQAKTTIKLNKSSATVYVSNTVQLKATVKGTKSKVKWTSSNSKVASVSSKGKVTAKKKGTATIKAKVNGKTASCKVTVTYAPDLSKVVNKTVAKAAKMLGLSYVTNGYIYSNKKPYSKGTYIMSGLKSEKNKAGRLFADIVDKRIAVFGVKIGMTLSQANSILRSKGWVSYYSGFSQKNGAVITASTSGSKITHIHYQWVMEYE